MPVPPNVLKTSSPFRQTIQGTLTLLNPCFNVYYIIDICPFFYDPLQEDLTKCLSTDLLLYFNHIDVQKAINALIGDFTVYVGKNFVTKDEGDNAPKSFFTILPKVSNRTSRNFVINGALDMLIPSNGTLFSLQIQHGEEV
jgi:carboxypeptidase D